MRQCGFDFDPTQEDGLERQRDLSRKKPEVSFRCPGPPVGKSQGNQSEANELACAKEMGGERFPSRVLVVRTVLTNP